MLHELIASSHTLLLLPIFTFLGKMTKSILNSFKAFLTIFVFLAVDSFIAKGQLVETGVSGRLAKSRKEILSNIDYTIHLKIPSDKEQPIPANEIISFHLKKNTSPLQIDFKEKRE